MFACVKFNVGMRGVWVCCQGSAGKGISEEEGVDSLMSSSIVVVAGCFIVVASGWFAATASWIDDGERLFRRMCVLFF